MEKTHVLDLRILPRQRRSKERRDTPPDEMEGVVLRTEDLSGTFEVVVQEGFNPAAFQ